MASTTAQLCAAAVLCAFLIARASGQLWQQGGAYGGGQGPWYPPYSQQPWTADRVSWGTPTPSFAGVQSDAAWASTPAFGGGQSDAAWGWSPNSQNQLHHQHGFLVQHDPIAQQASYEHHGRQGHHGQHEHDLPVVQPAPFFGWAHNAVPGWGSVTPPQQSWPQQSWPHQPSPHQPSTLSSGWDASWDVGMMPYEAAPRWARSSSSQQQPPAWLRDPAVPRPLGTVLLDGGIRVSVRDFRHILEHYKTGAWRDVTTETGARMVSETFDEFERSASKFAVQVPLADGTAVPALTYCLVVRSVTDDKTHAVLEVPDGSTCPLRQLADRADVASWMHAMFPEGLRPRQHQGTPRIWAPPAATTTTTPRPHDATSTTPPPATTARPPQQEVKESPVAEQEDPAGKSAGYGHPHPPLQGHAAGDLDPAQQQHGRQRLRQAPRGGQRLPAIWSPGLAQGPAAPSNSIDHIVQPHAGGLAN